MKKFIVYWNTMPFDPAIAPGDKDAVYDTYKEAKAMSNYLNKYRTAYEWTYVEEEEWND